MRLLACLLALLTVACLAGVARADLNVPITVTERAGVARPAEPVTCGVPLPKGQFDDASSLVLLGPDGKQVPAAITPVVLWHPTKTVKWVHVDFVASAPANGKTVYTLATGKPSSVSQPIRVDQADGKVTVDTGAVRFVVKGKGFNLFDEVTAGGKQIIAPHNGGGLELLSSHMGLAKNVVYSAANFDATTVEVEAKNAVKAVIKVTGQHVAANPPAGATARLLDYELRIYAYRGSPIVKVSYTVMNRQENRIHVPAAVDGWAIDLPLASADDSHAAMSQHDGKLVMEPLAGRLVQQVDSSNHYTVRLGDKLLAEGPTKETLTRQMGYVAYGSRGGQMVAGIRRFWQLWPKAVEASAGRVRLHLWPNLDGKVLRLPEQDENTPPGDTYFDESKQFPLERALASRLMPGRAHFFPGMSKTHEMVFAFGPGEPAAAWMAIEQPLRGLCPPSWYCEQTQAFGRLASSTPELFSKEVFEQVKQYDARLRDWYEFLVNFRSQEYGKDYGVYDQYGMFDYGDSINFDRAKGRDKKPNETKPVSIQWDNCYYDFPHAMMLQFLRTGDQDLMEHAIEADAHYMDVDMVCHHPDASFIGASRYCPGRMHICQEGTGIYVSDTYNHFKNLCHFDQWYMLGDYHARDRGYMAAGFVVARGRSALSQARSVGHGIRAALEAYRAGGDEKYLKAAQGLVNYNFTRTGSGAWQDGIAVEGFRELYEQTGDEKLVGTIKNAVDAARAKKDYAPAILHGFGFVYAQTGDASYRDAVANRLPSVGKPRKFWGSTMDYGNTLRNAPYMFWYLSDTLSPPKK